MSLSNIILSLKIKSLAYYLKKGKKKTYLIFLLDTYPKTVNKMKLWNRKTKEKSYNRPK